MQHIIVNSFIRITNLVVNNIQFVRNANEIPFKRDLIGVRADIIKIMLKCEREYLLFNIFDQIILVNSIGHNVQ